MNKSIWGPVIWNFIHISSLHYTDIDSYIKFIYLLQDLLPCSVCKEHLKQNLINLPLSNINLNNNYNTFLWSYYLHSTVNKQLKKQDISIKNALDKYASIPTTQFYKLLFQVTQIFINSYTLQTTEQFRLFVYNSICLLPNKTYSDNLLLRKYIRLLQNSKLTNNILQSQKSLNDWLYNLKNNFI